MDQHGSVPARSFVLVKRRLGTLSAAAAWPFALLALGFGASSSLFRLHYQSTPSPDPTALWYSLGVLPKMGVILAYLITGALPHALAIAGVSVVVWQDLCSTSVGFRYALAQIRKVFWRLLFLSLGLFFATQVASYFFVVPGILVMVFTSFAIPVLVIEQTSLRIALEESFTLASARFWAIAALCLTFVLFMVLALFTLLAELTRLADLNLPWWQSYAACWVVLIMTLSFGEVTYGTMLVHFYHNLRKKRGELATDTPGEGFHG